MFRHRQLNLFEQTISTEISAVVKFFKSSQIQPHSQILLKLTHQVMILKQT